MKAIEMKLIRDLRQWSALLSRRNEEDEGSKGIIIDLRPSLSSHLRDKKQLSQSFWQNQFY
jgi:hypothetical protein